MFSDAYIKWATYLYKKGLQGIPMKDYSDNLVSKI